MNLCTLTEAIVDILFSFSITMGYLAAPRFNKLIEENFMLIETIDLAAIFKIIGQSN